MKQYQAIRQALQRTAHRDDCTITNWSIQSNHLHLICEPRSKQAMARSMMAFKTSRARRLNGIVARKGRVFGDRHHCVYLTTPAQVRAAVASLTSASRPGTAPRQGPCAGAGRSRHRSPFWARLPRSGVPSGR